MHLPHVHPLHMHPPHVRPLHVHPLHMHPPHVHPRCVRGAEIYFGVITFSTIGYGDVTPHTKGGKMLATFLVAMGIFSFTTVLGNYQQITLAKKMGAEKTLRERLAELNEVRHGM